MMADTGFLVLPKLLPYYFTVEFHFEANLARTKYFCHGYCIDRQMINVYEYKPKILLEICSKFNQKQYSSIVILLLLTKYGLIISNKQEKLETKCGKWTQKQFCGCQKNQKHKECTLLHIILIVFSSSCDDIALELPKNDSVTGLYNWDITQKQLKKYYTINNVHLILWSNRLQFCIIHHTVDLVPFDFF